MSEDRVKQEYLQNKQRKKRREEEQHRTRMLRGMMGLCLVTVCVGTAVLATGFLNGNREKEGGGNRGRRAAAVRCLWKWEPERPSPA